MKTIVREAEITDIEPLAQLVVKTWKETYEGLFPPAFFETFNFETQKKVTESLILNKPSFERPFVAVSDGELAGYCHASVQSQHGRELDSELHVIYLLRKYQRKGIGKMMLRSAVERLKQAGCGRMFCWVVSDNPTRMFYEKSGGKLQQEIRKRNFGGEDIRENLYRWDNLEELVSWLE